jgi:hypothetical protein
MTINNESLTTDLRNFVMTQIMKANLSYNTLTFTNKAMVPNYFWLYLENIK